ncbi:MAG: aldo/keto reductase [Bacillota bacterium]|nr:aldo/keto reductase [Bacillota bacterium]
MEYRVLGKSNLKVSVVGFGGIPVQRISIEEAKTVILKAEELGINFIDSAKGYTVSEEYIGHALEGRREKWILATKSMARDAESMKNDIETSLKNFKTDYIDLYQIHNAKTKEDYDKILSESGAYKALEQAKSEGKIGHIGITSHSLDILKLAIESGKFETIMYPYNIVENQAEELFKRAAELNIGIIAMKPLAGGAIQDGTLAIKYILDNKNVTTAIPGMATVNEVEENVAAANNFISLTEEEKHKALLISQELGSEFCRRCGYCGPCPQGIDIPSMFLFEGYKKRYALSTWAEDRYFNCSKTAKDCVECGSCEKKCPYNLPIRSMLKEVKKSFNDL